jgi:hypothetical protein
MMRHTHRRPLGSAVLALVFLLAGCTSTGTTDSPASASDPSTSSIAGTTSIGAVTTLPGLSADELLAGDDFFPEKWGEGLFSGGLGVHVCGNIEMLDREPLSELDDNVAIRLWGPESNVQEIVFADSEEVIQAAYDEIVANLVDCIDNPDRWLEGVDDEANPETGTTRWDQRLEYIDLPSDHDGDRFAFAFTFYDNGEEFCHHHVAIIRSGSRLAILESGEMRGKRLLSYSEIAHIVEHAAERLAS